MGTALISDTAIANPPPSRPRYLIERSLITTDDMSNYTEGETIVNKFTGSDSGGFPLQWKNVDRGNNSTVFDGNIITKDPVNTQTGGAEIDCGTSSYKADFDLVIPSDTGDRKGTMWVYFFRGDSGACLLMNLYSSGTFGVDFIKPGAVQTIASVSQLGGALSAGEVHVSVALTGSGNYRIAVGDNVVNGNLTTNQMSGWDRGNNFRIYFARDAIPGKGIKNLAIRRVMGG